MTQIIRLLLGRTFCTVAFLFMLVLILPHRAALGAVPGTIAYQGFLATSSGSPVNGTVTIVFRLYTTSTGGSPIWSETQNVSVANGAYTVLLGSVTSLNSAPFNTPYYLGVTVGPDAEMTPRQPLSSAPYALRAAIADTVISTPIAATTTRSVTSTSGVGSSSCGDNELLVGGGCECKGSRTSGTNYGVLFACTPAGNGFAGACYDYLFSSLYGPSPVAIRAICLTGIAFVGSSAGKAAADGMDEETVELLARYKAQREELNQAR